ncbi:MAG: PD-(D/E)XK nuclease family protein [Deltaproteobacteria bacterium]|nr:PD-(D/E)XK nuclease family protein [Deltaproteobacteria bacterium]
MTWKTGYTIEDGATQSMLAAFLDCRERMGLTLSGWEKKTSSKSAMRFGSMVHSALEELYKAMGRGAVGNLERVIERSITKSLRKNIVGSSDAYQAQEMELEANRARAVLGEYLNEHTSDIKREWIAVEPVFDVMFRGFRLRGRIDGVFRKAKSVWMLETKTKGRISEDALTSSLSFDWQTLFYLTALKAMMDDPVKGALYNIIRNPQLKQKKGEDETGFIARIRKDAYERPDHYFKRFELTFPKVVVKTFEDELEAILKDFAAWVAGDLPTYRRRQACVGMWSCEFLDMCASGDNVGFAQTRKLFRELEDDDDGSGEGGEKAAKQKRKVKRRKA